MDIKSGIYKITNTINKNFYIGSSKNVNKRIEEHRNKLKRNNHINIILQRAWNKYGENYFSFEILEECEIEILFEREQYYIDYLNPKYNIGLKASGGDNLTNNPKRDDIIKKMSITNKMKYDILSDCEKKLYSEKFIGEKNPNFGNKWTEEMKEKARTNRKEFYKDNDPINKGKKLEEILTEKDAKRVRKILSEAASKRIGEKNPFFGKSHSEETKKILRNNRLGKYYGEQNIPFVINEKEYDSLGMASKELDIPITTIRWRLNSKNIKFENYKYKNI